MANSSSVKDLVEAHVKKLLDSARVSLWTHPPHPKGGHGQEEAILNGLIEQGVIFMRQAGRVGNPPYREIARGPRFEAWREQWQRS